MGYRRLMTMSEAEENIHLHVRMAEEFQAASRKNKMNRKLEAMSDAEHAKWASWMQYLFSVSRQNKVGTVTIPKDQVDRWKRQMDTPYADLSEREKQSDRDVVNEFFADLPGVNLKD